MTSPRSPLGTPIISVSSLNDLAHEASPQDVSLPISRAALGAGYCRGIDLSKLFDAIPPPSISKVAQSSPNLGSFVLTAHLV